MEGPAPVALALALAKEYPGCNSSHDIGTRRKEVHLSGLRPDNLMLL